MLAERREFTVMDERKRTPLVVPSYSSRVSFKNVKEMIQMTSEYVKGSFLVSVYDIHYSGIKRRHLSHSSLLFLDSGGYEAGEQADLSEIEDRVPKRKNWSRSDYRNTVKEWNCSIPTVLVSYDNPKRHLSLSDQIVRARKDFDLAPKACSDILLKPVPLPLGRRNERRYLDIDLIVRHIREFDDFDIIGVTEKELGDSMFQRMLNIAKIRKALSETGFDKPIHLFGSLDPVSTPLYFFAGADIFDGLTWLRYAYHDDLAVYKQDFLASGKIPIETRDGELSAHIHISNYRELGILEEKMRRFLANQDFSVFGSNKSFFENAVANVKEELTEQKNER